MRGSKKSSSNKLMFSRNMKNYIKSCHPLSAKNIANNIKIIAFSIFNTALQFSLWFILRCTLNVLFLYVLKNISGINLGLCIQYSTIATFLKYTFQHCLGALPNDFYWCRVVCLPRQGINASLRCRQYYPLHYTNHSQCEGCLQYHCTYVVHSSKHCNCCYYPPLKKSS